MTAPFRVLVVIEDDEDFRRLIRFTLDGDADFVLDGQAASAEEALPLAESMQPDLVILDHFIEGTIMGVELAPLIKKLAPDTRILLFTTHDLAVESAREPAIDRYLRKQELERLRPTVREMLGLG